MTTTMIEDFSVGPLDKKFLTYGGLSILIHILILGLAGVFLFLPEKIDFPFFSKILDFADF